MLDQKTIDTVKATRYILAEAGPDLTDHFYKRMFSHNPELKHIFNLTNQHSGRQQVALFEAIAAYANNIENLEVLKAAVERIAQKHTSFNIQPQHYDIVGAHLIETLRELAGDLFTPDVEEAWVAAYGFLANIFIGRERDLYQDNSDAKGGWSGRRRFKLVNKIVESELVSSFVFSPLDERAVIGFAPGQYLGVEVHPPSSEFREIRQYSLSDKPNGDTYRISVKRELAANDGSSDGVVSNHLHDDLQVGDEVDLHAPAGDFFFVDRARPVVLISAGVGLTPMQSALETLYQSDYSQAVHYLHAAQSPEQHSFADRVTEICWDKSWQQHIWYQQASEGELADHICEGYLNVSSIQAKLPLEDGDYYLCGPVGFMKFVKDQLLELGVSDDRIHYEVFGPHQQL